MANFQNKPAPPPRGAGWEKIGKRIWQHPGPVRIKGHRCQYGGMTIDREPLTPRFPVKKAWTPKGLDRRNRSFANRISERRSLDSTNRNFNQTQSRNRSIRDARERAERQARKQEQTQLLRDQLQHKREQQEHQRDLQERLRKERERKNRERMQLQKRRGSFLGSIMAGLAPPAFRAHTLRRPEMLHAQGKTLLKKQADRTASRGKWAMENLSFRVDQVSAVVGGLIGMAGQHKGVVGTFKALKGMKLHPKKMQYVSIPELSFKQKLREVGGEYHLLIDELRNVRGSGMGSFKFPTEFKKLATRLGKPVRAGFHANLKKGSDLDKILQRIGHTTKEPLFVEENGLFRGALTKVYYPDGWVKPPKLKKP